MRTKGKFSRIQKRLKSVFFLVVLIAPPAVCFSEEIKEKKAKVEAGRRLEEKIGKEIHRDEQYIAYSKGVVLDTETGFMWAASDNGRDVIWSQAKSFCENYRGAGYKDWRMPTVSELATLYDNDKKNRYGFFVTKLIDISSCCPWASETRGSVAASFDFSSGKWNWSSQCQSYFFYRALPVRSSK